MNRRTVNLTLALVPSLLISGIGRAEAMAYRGAPTVAEGGARQR